MANTNVEIKRGTSENTLGVLRRFTKRVQESGILPKVRGGRYNTREESALKQKRGKLKKLARGKEYERLKKLGKLVDKKKRK